VDDPIDDQLLTLDEAFRATFHFVEQYYRREPIEPFELMLHSMTPIGSGDRFDRATLDPATWHDWMKSVETARATDQVPEAWRPGT
jgi:hypothetical protein